MITRQSSSYYVDRTQAEETIGHEKDLAIKGNVLIVVDRLLDSKTEMVKGRILIYKTLKRQYE